LRSIILLAVALILLQQCYSFRDPLVGRDSIIDLADGVGAQAFESISVQIADDPYNPGSFAWGWQYHARGCLIMYNLTGERKWLDWAVNLSDHFLEYSDVNGDGEPCWGNYNETWGNSRYDFREYTVWDGVIGLPMVEVAKIIIDDDLLSKNITLLEKANAYIDMMERLVQRHHSAWEQVDEDMGYYWDDPYEDVGPIVNRFTALGRAELVLGDVTGNNTYYDKPRQMANFMVANMVYHPSGDLYTWKYSYGKEASEDISHGAIDLEFLIMANRRGLLDEIHLRRLANTYLENIWQVPLVFDGKHLLAMRVDGSDPIEYDYARISRGWALLAPYNPDIYECQRMVFGIIHERSGLYASSITLLGLSQIPLMASVLEDMGINPDGILVIDRDTLVPMLEKVGQRVDETLSLGSQAPSTIQLVDEAGIYISEGSLKNASVPIGLMLKAWDVMGRIMETGQRLQKLAAEVDEAEVLGIPIVDIRANLSRIQEEFRTAEKNSILDRMDGEILELEITLEKIIAETMIILADEVVAQAKQAGIDTSRHEIFLSRAHEEFDEGNYGPARQFTVYPLRLRDEIPELPRLLVIALCTVVLALGKPILFIRPLILISKCSFE